MTYTVTDNFLDEEVALNIRKTLLSGNFPWYYHDAILYGVDKDLLSFQFNHMFYRDYQFQSPEGQLVVPLLERINPLAMIRIKANLKPLTPDHHYGGWHKDVQDDCTIGVYYVNDNNGWTEFENGEKVYSKANRFVEFSSKELHSGVSCTDEQVRSVINFVYIKR